MIYAMFTLYYTLFFNLLPTIFIICFPTYQGKRQLLCLAVTLMLSGEEKPVYL